MFYVNPFSRPTKWFAPDGKGVYALPHSTAAPEGWGEPRRDANGDPITPGTAGGDHPHTLIHKKEGTYKGLSSKYLQKSGNITWWGKFIDPAHESKGRHVLSYYGPKLRYFRELGRDYGSSAAHNEIYYKGGYASVAPGPVLGACIRFAPYTDPETGQTNQEQPYLYVAVYQGGQDKFYRKRWAYQTIPPHKFTDADRAREMALFDDAERPLGWELIGTFARPSAEHYKPETPWFFNESGTEALNMRRKKVTFDNGSGTNVTEETFDRLAATISHTGVSVANLGNLPAMEYEEVIAKTSHATDDPASDFISTDFYGYTHYWVTNKVQVDIQLQGEQYVMCDFIGDTRYWGKVKYDIIRQQISYFAFGADDIGPSRSDPNNWVYNIPGQGSTNIANTNQITGQYYEDIRLYNYDDPTYVAQQDDGHASDWVLTREQVRLYYGPEGDEEDFYIDLHTFNSGTSDEWAGHPKQSTNPRLFFYEFNTRYLRGLFDIRDLAAFAYNKHRYGLWQTPTSTVSTTTEHTNTLYSTENLAGEKFTSTQQSGSGAIEFGWLHSTMTTWADTIDETIVRTTYNGTYSTDNANAELFDPGSQTFYTDGPGDFLTPLPTLEDLLYSEDNADCKGNGVRTERQELGLAVEVPNVETPGQYVVVSDHKPGGAMDSIIGFGEKFYPVGAC